MRKFALPIGICGAALGLFLQAMPAQAQATGTWVSGVGDDVNPCSRTAPCKTYAGAISKTAAGGEIRTLDPGGFGAVTITKAITITGDGTLASILAAGSNGIIINAAATDKVFIRNVSLQGAGTGLAGIRFLNGGQLTVENVTIDGFTGNGIETSPTVAADVYLRNVRISKVNHGVSLTSTGPFLVASLDNVSILNPTGSGVTQSSNGIGTTITNSVIASAGTSGVAITAGNGFINIDSSSILNSNTGINATSGTIRISNNNLYGNPTAYVGNANIQSSGNNRTGANGAGAPGGPAIVQQ
jgi:hypothetical protein